MKEALNMVHRGAVMAVLTCVVLVLLVLPAAEASAAPSPWWQVLTGSRPSNLWEPEPSVTEIKTETVEFGGGVAAIKLEIGGVVKGCLGTKNLFGNILCEANTGFQPAETAAEVQALFEAATGSSEVEVTGGPVGGEPFKIVAAKPVGAITATAITGGASVKVVSPGGSGRLVVTVTNLGDADVDATENPVTITDELPQGVLASGVEATAGVENLYGPLDCAVEGGDQVSCTFEGILPSYEGIEVEIQASLTGEPPAAGDPGQITVSGGNAPGASASQKIKVSPEPTPFGIDLLSAVSEEEGGGPVLQAGSHPFQLTTTIQFNAGQVVPGSTDDKKAIEQPALPRNVRVSLPAGLAGNATSVEECEMQKFFEQAVIRGCAPETAVGVASVTIVEGNILGLTRVAVPIFNLPPAQGEPARFGFKVEGAPIVIDTAVDPDNEYKIVAEVRNASQLADVLSSTVVFWGTPGDPRHDNSRGWACTSGRHPLSEVGPCERPPNLSERALLRQPVSCVTPLEFGVELEPWNVPLGSVIENATYIGEPMSGCNQVPFGPKISSSPSSKLAGNPSGLNLELEMPNSGLLSGPAIAEGQAKKIEVVLPEGMSINPSQGEGLVGCSPDDLARETSDSKPGEGCPEASKIGEVQISTPLLAEEARGSLFVASPYDNPFDSLIAIYMVARIPDRGVLVKQAGVVRTNSTTGQITSVFDDLPQIPISNVQVRFREGGRAPLVTPSQCGDFDIVAKFTPWSASNPFNPQPEEIVTKTNSFTIEHGVDGGACPGGGAPPFHPGLLAGTINNAAGSYSPFSLRLTRNDGEQEFTNFSIKLPPGVTAKLAGVDACSDAAIAAARARTGSNGGLEEIESPSCPANSQIGRTLVGAGVGSSLTYVPGKIYLAGPFNGAPLSIVAITAARVGPFDLGTVVIRQAIRVNPETAEVFIDPTGSDPIPHIIQGIPVHARDIRAYVDRADFTLNPTNCEPTSTASTVLGSGLDFGSPSDDEPVTVTSPFQAADCASLGFKPSLSLQLLGGTKRGDTPRLKAVLKTRKGDANTGRAQVTLPHSAFLEQAHIRTVCTRVQFKAGGGNGEQCPKGSVYGKAKAITPLLDEPVQGKVYLRSSDHELPDLVAALHSGKIDVNLVGRIDSLNGRIRTTFDSPPDVPVTKFTLEMQGGQKGLIVNSTNICIKKHRAIAALKGQNGRLHEFNPVVKAKCGGKKAKKGKARAH